jgi:hypothetical protein
LAANAESFLADADTCHQDTDAGEDSSVIDHILPLKMEGDFKSTWVIVTGHALSREPCQSNVDNAAEVAVPSICGNRILRILSPISNPSQKTVSAEIQARACIALLPQTRGRHPKELRRHYIVIRYIGHWSPACVSETKNGVIKTSAVW